MSQHNKHGESERSAISNTGGYECENCKRRYRRESSICPHCEFPINGAEEEKQIFYNNLEAAKLQLHGMEEKVSWAKLSLWIISAINFIFAIVYFLYYPEINDASLILIINLLSAVIFLLLGVAAKENPFTALTIGFILYVALILYRIIDDQPDMLMGFFMRDVFILWILKGISNTRTAEELQKQIRKRQP